MQATLAELAALVDGQLIGDGDLVIHGAAPMNHATPGQITLTDDCPDRHYNLSTSRASAIVAGKAAESTGGLPTLQVDDIHAAFTKILLHFNPPRKKPRIGVSPLAVISPTAKLDEDVDVHPYATVGDDVYIGPGSTIHTGAHIMAGSKIGREVTIFPGAVLYEDTIVGARCIIHGCAVLGANGFGYTLVEGRHVLSAQLGNVILEADVEVGACTTIDRGTYGPTIVGEGTKIDNQVMVAHNCRIGRHNMLCSQVGIAGSTTTGDYVTMAGQVGVRDHVHVGNGAVLGAMAGITNDVPDGKRMIGIPATPEREQKLKQAALSKLPEMRRQMKKLQKTVEHLEADLEAIRHLAGKPSSEPIRRAVA